VTKPIGGKLADIGKHMMSNNRMPNMDEVICPGCGHQFRAIPQNVQEELAEAQAEITELEAQHEADCATIAEQALRISELNDIATAYIKAVGPMESDARSWHVSGAKGN
jgi:uncharacterized Zn finger protein (UPF0148 family)